MSTLEIKEDLSFQKHESLAQHIGWTILALFLIAAVIGLFGKGPIASSEVASQALRIEYDRFARKGADTTLLIELKNNGANQAAFWIDAEFIEKTKVERIEPEPLRSVIHEGKRGEPGVEYVFDVDPSTTDLIVQFTYQPTDVGARSTSISTGESNVVIKQFVYP